MRKILFIVVGVLTAFLIVTGFNAAYAGENNNRCHDVHGLIVDCSETTNIDKSNTAYGGTGVGVGIGTGGNANAVGVIGGSSLFGDSKTLSPEANADAKAEVKNSGNSAINIGNGFGNKVLSPEQDQKQGQVQGQNQSTKNSNNSKQNTKVTFTDNSVYEDKRDLINPTVSPKADAKLSEGKAYTGKTKGSIWSDLMDMSVPLAAAKGLSKAGGDVEITLALMGENDFQTSHVIVSENPSGVLMGIVYASPDGDDCFAAGMEGKALIAAMKAGATGIKRISMTDGQETSGSAWNVGLGGGASMFAKGDDIAIAPNGGLGYGSASASNEKRPEMAFKIYFDESLVKGMKVPAQSGNHRN